MAGEWIDTDRVKAVLGADLSEPIDVSAMDEVVAGTRAHVESKRRDLFVVTEDDPPVTTFTPGADVVLGAALLAHRFYKRRTTALGVLGVTAEGASGILREDPDIARLLGIGKHRGFRFGGARVPEVVEVV